MQEVPGSSPGGTTRIPDCLSIEVEKQVVSWRSARHERAATGRVEPRRAAPCAPAGGRPVKERIGGYQTWGGSRPRAQGRVPRVGGGRGGDGVVRATLA